MASSSSAAAASSRAVRMDQSPESFESLGRRNNAALILQSFEKLAWHSFNRRESLQQTRLHFQNIVAGFTPADEAALVNYPMDNTQKHQEERRNKVTGSKGKEKSLVAVDGSASPSASPGGRSKTGSRGGESSAKKKRKSAVR